MKTRHALSIILSFMLLISTPLIAYASCPISESTDMSASAEAEKYYNMLPAALRNQFESEGWEIMISSVAAVNLASAALGGVSGAGYVAGFTHSLSKMIMLADTDAGRAVNHEMGHYFDYSSGMVSDSAGFIDIFQSEAVAFDGGNNDYAVSDSGEFFAEAFREYIECAGYLKRTCPRTYDYINGLMITYGGTQTEGITELTKCDSRIIDAVAKAAADAAAKAARNAAQNIIDSGAALVGTKAPRLDKWLDGYGDLINGINNDPEGYAKRKTDEWKDYLEGIDWDKKNEETRAKVNETMNEVNEKLADTEYWEQKGKEVGDMINGWFGGH